MGYVSDEGNIIKPNPLGWLLVFGAILALGIVVIQIFLFSSEREPDNPPWAPSGCTVHFDTSEHPTISIDVNELENFDTEAEIAGTILTALDEEADFFNAPENQTTGSVILEVNFIFPSTAAFRNPAVQYTEGRPPVMVDAMLRVINVSPDLYRYLYTDINPVVIESIANGEMELGFLDWLPDAYNRPEDQ